MKPVTRLAILGVALMLLAVDIFMVIQIALHGFPVEAFTHDYPSWRSRVVITGGDVLIVAGLCAGHVFIVWAYLRQRARAREAHR